MEPATSPAKILVFDLFTGMGGCWHALNSLGIPPGPASGIKMIMFETDPPARALLAAKAGSSGWLNLSDDRDTSGETGSVLALTDNNCRLLRTTLDHHKEVTHVLFAGGSPCQGFSRANPNSKGVRDPRSALIWVFHALPAAAMAHLGGRASVAVVLENVVMKNSSIEGNVSRLLGSTPQLANANLWTSCDRDRNFWSSYPSSPLPDSGGPQPDFDAVLFPGWRPLWELTGSNRRPRFSCFLRPWPPGGPQENITSFWKFSLHRYDDHGLVYRPDSPPEVLKKIVELVTGASNNKAVKQQGSAAHSSRADLCNWIHAGGGDKYLRPLNANERDVALGFPSGASRLPTGYPTNKLGEEFERCLLSGNAWSPPAAAHVLKHLSRHILEGSPLETNLAIPKFVSVDATLTFLQPDGQACTPKGGGKGRR